MQCGAGGCGSTGWQSSLHVRRRAQYAVKLQSTLVQDEGISSGTLLLAARLVLRPGGHLGLMVAGGRREQAATFQLRNCKAAQHVCARSKANPSYPRNTICSPSPACLQYYALQYYAALRQRLHLLSPTAAFSPASHIKLLKRELMLLA